MGCNILLIYLLTPWCRVLLEQLPGLQVVKQFPAFHGTRRFITALTSVRHLSLSWASSIQSTYPHPTYWRSGCNIYCCFIPTAICKFHSWKSYFTNIRYGSVKCCTLTTLLRKVYRPCLSDNYDLCQRLDDNTVTNSVSSMSVR